VNNLKPGIQHIIFDLGGVLINLDYGKTNEAFINLGFPHFDDMFSQFTADRFFEKLETGQIDTETFYKVITAIGKTGLTREQVRDAWNAMLLDFRKESLDYLRQLQAKYTIYLLSNTNAIHLEAVEQIYINQFGKGSLNDYFTKTWYSHLIGYRKPHAETYAFVLQDAGISAENTLFIDDTAPNIETARQLGFHTHLLLKGEKIEDLGL
jgi:putative hydrolase of the HAD superfamily